MIETKPPVQVVVAYDFTPSSEEALSRAIEVVVRAPQHVLHIVTALDAHDRITAMGIVEGASYDIADRVHTMVMERVTAAFAGRSTASEVQCFVHARIGKAATTILGLAAEVGADLIFVGTHGKTGVERLLLGSVSERVVREAGCPVLVARAKTYPAVDLLRVVRYDHVRTPHREPHCYTYVNRQVIMRPPEWPLY